MASRRADALETSGNDSLLKEIRERFKYASEAWQDIRDEAKRDLRYISGDPWDPEDRSAREDAGRPCLSLDELSQYVNQLINDVRQNKRGIKVTAQGNGASEQTAELRANLIRQIEYRSNSQQGYTQMFEDAVQRSYGFVRVVSKFESPYSFNQELLIEALPNPDLVTPDPDCYSPTSKGMRYCFVHEAYRKDRFKAEFPGASMQSFTSSEVKKLAPEWVRGDGIVVAEYWKLDTRADTAYMMQPDYWRQLSPEALKRSYLRKQAAQAQAGRPFVVLLTDLGGKEPATGTYLQTRAVEVPYVCKYFTNGIELLKHKGQKDAKIEWPGSTIPIVSCYGKVLYVNGDAGVERKILSLIRLARDPQMLYCYYRTTEAELVGMSPKTPFIGYVGQFRGQESKWEKVNAHPMPYLEVNPTTEKTGQSVLPFPQRQPYDPPIQSLEIGAESARRAIQAAIGTNPLPTQAQRKNEKSGVALKQIEETAQKGSFHFVDHFDYAIAEVGSILDEVIPVYYDTARDVTIRKPDDSPEVIRINDANVEKPYDATAGDHDVTISVGPAYQSQREQASDFADQLAANPAVFPIIGDLIVKLKNLGPTGDEIAERLKFIQPPELRAAMEGDGKNLPPEAQAAIGQLKMQLQQMQQQLQQAAQEIQTKQAEADAKVKIAAIDAQKDKEIAKIRADIDFAIAQLNAVAKNQQVSGQVVANANEQIQQHQHEAVQAELDRQHEAQMTMLSHQHAQEQAEQGAQIAAAQAAQQESGE